MRIGNKSANVRKHRNGEKGMKGKKKTSVGREDGYRTKWSKPPRSKLTNRI